MSELVFPQPLSLAVGSHTAGTGFGCAMNVVSWEQGVRITDYPECAAPPLARMVQGINDLYCSHTTKAQSASGYLATVLCPPCSLDVLDLAHRTVGTAGATPGELWLWMADLLVGKNGVVHHLAEGDAIAFTEYAAEVAVRRAAGDVEASKIRTAPMSSTSFSSGTQRRALGIASTVMGRVPALDLIALDVLGIPFPSKDVLPPQSVESCAKSVGYQCATISEDVTNRCCGWHVKNPAALLEAGHHVIDSWERVTGVTAPLVLDADVIAAVDKMLATSA